MLGRLESLVGKNGEWGECPLVICGDFNSLPESGPYELLTTGKTSAVHPDMSIGTDQKKYSYGRYSEKGFSHSFRLASAYASLLGEPPFTNCTLDFVGVLDYIFYSVGSLVPTKVLEPVDFALVKGTRLPNAYFCSDHLSLMAELRWE